MAIELSPTQMEYEFEDAGGYRFHVVASLDSEFGWAAHVSFGSRGMKTPEGAVNHLRLAADRFLRMLTEPAVRPIEEEPKP